MELFSRRVLFNYGSSNDKLCWQREKNESRKKRNLRKPVFLQHDRNPRHAPAGRLRKYHSKRRNAPLTNNHHASSQSNSHLSAQQL